MPDIRKILEEQIETLRDASRFSEHAAECTSAMLDIVYVLYPEGIPEKEVPKLLNQDEEALKEIATSISENMCVPNLPKGGMIGAKFDTSGLVAQVANELRNSMLYQNHKGVIIKFD